jgi:hypothetical protein
LLSLVLLLPGAACDPLGPGAVGRLRLSPDAEIVPGGMLEMRAFPDDGQAFDPATTTWADRQWPIDQRWPLSEITFPFHYGIGGGVGHNETQSWRLVAWISRSENADAPTKGEWYGTQLFSLAECGFPFSGYCGVTQGIEIEIDRKY